MERNLCKKSCAERACREEIGCRGCAEQGAAECEIAKCCREKGHAGCETCTFGSSCGLLRQREDMPKLRAKAARMKAQQTQTAPMAARCAGLLLGFCLLTMATSILASSVYTENAAVNTALLLLPYLFAALEAAVLLRLTDMNWHYRTAGGTMLVAELASAVLTLLPVTQSDAEVISLLSLPFVILELVAFYHECAGHADIVEELDGALAKKWRRLWKWPIAGAAALVTSILLVYPLSFIAAGFAFAGFVALIAVLVLKPIYLWRTRKAFKALVRAYEKQNAKCNNIQ